MTHGRTRLWTLLAATSLAMAAAATVDAAVQQAATAPTPAAYVLPADARVEGESVAALTARWWQWANAMAFPPYRDPDGRLCELGQSGPVWFLAGTDGSFEPQRRCTVPEGRHLLVPIINMYRSGARDVGDADDAALCARLQASVAVNNDRLGSAVVLLDGEPLAQASRMRVRSDGCFPADPADPEGHIAAADGYWLLLAPLPRGRHRLVVGANYAGEDAFGELSQNFEYLIDVGGDVQVVMR